MALLVAEAPRIGEQTVGLLMPTPDVDDKEGSFARLHLPSPWSFEKGSSVSRPYDLEAVRDLFRRRADHPDQFQD